MPNASSISRRGLAAAFAAFAAVAAGPTVALAADAPARILTGPIPPVPGPRRTIAVGNIDMMGPYATPSATNVGGPLGAMLTTALTESDRFNVVERDAMAQMINEMDLAKSKVTAGAGPMPGAMIPAQYLVVGSVTAYSTGDKGGGLSIGGMGAMGTLGRSHGSVALDLRLVDTRTGQVVKAFKVERKITATTFGISGTYQGVPMAANRFFNTPLGDATRKALNDAVVQIATTLGAQPWRGQIVKADGAVIWVNAGSEAGVAVGDEMRVQHLGEALTDPATGQVLSQNMVDLGTVVITRVEAKFAVGGFKPSDPSAAPVRGDYLLLTPR